MQLVALDIETSVETGEPACLTWSVAVPDATASAGWRAGDSCGVHARDPRARDVFAAWLDDPEVVLVGQNVAFDLVALGRWWGLLPRVRAAYEAGRVRDTMLRQHLLDIAWPARPRGVYNEELERWFPAKFAWHAGLGRMVRIDDGKSEDGGGGGGGVKVGLDALAWRLLAVDISGDKHDPTSWRKRYGELLDVPWEQWPDKARDYALGDPRITLEVYLEQLVVARQRSDPSRTAHADMLPPMAADGWSLGEVEAPLCDEQFQCMVAVPFEVMSRRGVRVDRSLVRRQREELRRLREWAADLCVRHGVMREVYDFAENDGGKTKPLKKGESPTPERIYRSLRSRCRKLQADDPAAFAEFLALARRLGKLRGVERKVDDGEKRRRVESILEARGVAVGRTAKGDKVKADADAIYEAATPLADVVARDPAARDLAAALGPGLLKVARRALAGSDARRASQEGRAEDAERLGRDAGGWSLERLAAAVEAAEDPGLAALAVYSKAEKFDSSFLKGLDVPDELPSEVRAWFRTMMETGRTSMVGAIRQNMPKAGGIRECIVPRPGFAFAQCDYSQIELLGLAFVLDSIFGRESSLTRAIREGVDCHLKLACHPLLGLGETYEEAKAHRKAGNAILEAYGSDHAAAERARPDFDWARLDRIEGARFAAKAANFGFPGGMMPRKFAATQKKQAGLIISIDKATALRQAWLETWPEIPRYFEWAKGMTSGERTARVRHLDGSHLAAGGVDGGADDVDDGHAGGGHWRGGCGYTQLCNTLFQGLVARGAKWAAWLLFVACYLTPGGPLDGCHPVLFVHDEFVLEVPVGREQEALAELTRIMVEAMRSVMPGQAVRAEGKILSERWAK